MSQRAAGGHTNHIAPCASIQQAVFLHVHGQGPRATTVQQSSGRNGLDQLHTVLHVVVLTAKFPLVLVKRRPSASKPVVQLCEFQASLWLHLRIQLTVMCAERLNYSDILYIT